MSRVCAVCSREGPRFVCQSCGNAVCERCFIPARWLCTECDRRPENYETAGPLRVGRVGRPREALLLIVSFLMIFIGVGLMMLSVGSGSLTGGALIFIGPIPIVFGQDTGGRALMAVGGLVAFMLIALWLWNMKHQIEIA